MSCKSLCLIFGAEVTHCYLEIGIDVTEVYLIWGNSLTNWLAMASGAHSGVLAVVKIDSDAIAGNLALGVSVDMVQKCIAQGTGLSYDSSSSTERTC